MYIVHVPVLTFAHLLFVLSYLFKDLFKTKKTVCSLTMSQVRKILNKAGYYGFWKMLRNTKISENRIFCLNPIYMYIIPISYR